MRSIRGLITSRKNLPDIDTFLEKTEQQGAEIVVGKHAVPGIGCNAFSRDFNATLFAVHQEDAQAKEARNSISNPLFFLDLIRVYFVLCN